MLWAQLSGKVPADHERFEDVLTSNVFGTIRYVPLRTGLVPILARVAGDDSSELRLLLENIDGSRTSSGRGWTSGLGMVASPM